MITDRINTKELFLSLDETWSELLKLISSADASIINTIPFEDSWTAAQLATHVTKSNKAIVQGLIMEGKPAERNPGERVQELKELFLDFTIKMKSPEFILPTQKTCNKEMILADLKKSIEQLKESGNKVNLSEAISHRAFGEITKFELLHFVLHHTQRHIHQLKEIIKTLKKPQVHE